jgi:hypothetical protein
MNETTPIPALETVDYYVGDLCYVLHDEWDEVCQLTINHDRAIGGEFNLKDGRRFAMYNTMYGDGTYHDQQGNEYGVDSGSIGCILMEDIDLEHQDNFVNCGAVHDFVQTFYTGEQDGKIMFHKVSIDTDDVVEEEEYDLYGE